VNRTADHVQGLPDKRKRNCRYCQKAAPYGRLLKSWHCPTMRRIVRECPLLVVERKDGEAK